MSDNTSTESEAMAEWEEDRDPSVDEGQEPAAPVSYNSDGEWLVKMVALKAYEAKAAELRKELEKHAPSLEEAAAALLPDGTPAGTVTWRSGYARAKVVDESKFLDYVTDHHPEQIEMAVSVEFRKHLLALALHTEIPGTEVTTVKGGYGVKPTADAYAMIESHRATDDVFARLVGLP